MLLSSSPKTSLFLLGGIWRIAIFSIIIITSTTKSLVSAIDFYLQFTPLDVGYGETGREILLTALDEFHPTARQTWISEVEAMGGTLTNIAGMGFDIDRWVVGSDTIKPAPNLYKYGNDSSSYVQGISYGYAFASLGGGLEEDDLDFVGYTRKAFESNDFLSILKQVDINATTTTTTTTNGIFQDVMEVKFISLEEYVPTHELKVVDIEDQPLHLELSPMIQGNVFTNSEVDPLLVALDTFMDDGIIATDCLFKSLKMEYPENDFYSAYSIYIGDVYFTALQYYLTPTELRGRFRDQYRSGDGVVTTFEYGYGLTYWTPINSTDITDTKSSIDSCFTNNTFTSYLLVEIQKNDTDPDEIEVFQTVTYSSAKEVYEGLTNAPTPSPQQDTPTTKTFPPSPMEESTSTTNNEDNDGADNGDIGGGKDDGNDNDQSNAVPVTSGGGKKTATTPSLATMTTMMMLVPSIATAFAVHFVFF